MPIDKLGYMISKVYGADCYMCVYRTVWMTSSLLPFHQTTKFCMYMSICTKSVQNMLHFLFICQWAKPMTMAMLLIDQVSLSGLIKSTRKCKFREEIKKIFLFLRECLEITNTMPLRWSAYDFMESIRHLVALRRQDNYCQLELLSNREAIECHWFPPK